MAWPHGRLRAHGGCAARWRVHAGVLACPLVPAASGAVAGQWASRVGLDGHRLLTAVSRVAGGGLGPVGLERARSSGAGILVRARCGPSLSAVCHPYGVYSCSCRTRVWGARCGRRSVALSRTLTGFLWRRPSGSAAVVGALWPGAACGCFLRARTGCGLRCVLLALVWAWLSAGFALCGRLVLSWFEAACAGAFLLLAAWGWCLRAPLFAPLSRLCAGPCFGPLGFPSRGSKPTAVTPSLSLSLH